MPSSLSIFLVFLRLGCLSFGGPIAHLGYFRRELIERRRWCSEETYAEIVALSQTVPGPASSQVGFTLGLLRGGLPGALAAWLGFTLPSAALMVAFAALGQHAEAHPSWLRVAHALQLVAVAVVAQAVIAMQRTLAPDLPRIALALVAAAITLFVPSSSATLIAILAGALAGALLPTGPKSSVPPPAPRILFPRRAALLAGGLFTLLLAFAFVISGSSLTIPHLGSALFRSGAIVFGGGHVVLPLLENAVVHPGWVSQQTFLSGYAAAQALPGPLFTFAAYLGASALPLRPLAGGLVALLAIFLPGVLLMLAILPFWSTLSRRPALAPAIRGIHAAVVGVLLAALIRPVASASLHTPLDVALAAAAFAALTLMRMPPWLLVLLFAAGAILGTLSV